MRVVSVIVTTHQGKRFLGACLSALALTELPQGWALQPIVVDNGSTDGTAEFLSSEFPQVEALIFVEPLGFAGANNAARDLAKGEVIVFLNNDTQVTPQWLRRPLEILEREPRVGVVGSRLVFMHTYRRCQVVGPPGSKVAVASQLFGNGLDDKVRWSPGASRPGSTRLGGMRWLAVGESFYVPDPIRGLDQPAPREPVANFLQFSGETEGLDVSCGGKSMGLSQRFPQARAIPEVEERVRLIQAAGGTLTREGDGGDFAMDLPPEEVALTETVVPTVCGAAYIARRSALDDVGWFPAGYVVYYEDTHLSMLLRSKNYLLIFCPDSVVYHYHTGTNREFSPFFIENVARSRLLFAAHFGAPTLIARRVIDQAGHSVREVLASTDAGPLAMWRRAPGLRGMVKSLPSVVRTAAQRLISGRFSARTSPLLNLSIERLPFKSSTSQRGHP